MTGHIGPLVQRSTPSIIAAASDIANTIPMVPPPDSRELVPKVTSPIWPTVCRR